MSVDSKSGSGHSLNKLKTNAPCAFHLQHRLVYETHRNVVRKHISLYCFATHFSVFLCSGLSRSPHPSSLNFPSSSYFSHGTIRYPPHLAQDPIKDLASLACDHANQTPNSVSMSIYKILSGMLGWGGWVSITFVCFH